MTRDTLKQRLRGWQFDNDVRRQEQLSRPLTGMPGSVYEGFIEMTEGTAIVSGGNCAAELAPLVPYLVRDFDVLEGAARGQPVSWVWMALCDQIATFAAMGVPGSDALLPRVKACLPSIQTSRNDERVYPHWNRGFAALALDVRFLYRPISGHEVNEPLRFVPGATFELNVQGFLGHLAAGVEQHAALADCEPAWHQLLANFPILERAYSLDSASLVWIAIILHHRIAGQPLATSADYLRDSVARVIATRAG